jgi:restriction system protein
LGIPDFQSIMRPMLDVLADGQERSIHDVRDRLADRFLLTSGERTEMLPSGKQTRFENRVARISGSTLLS